MDTEGNCSYVVFEVNAVNSAGCFFEYVSHEFSTFDIWSFMGTPQCLTAFQWVHSRTKISTEVTTFFYDLYLPPMFYFVPRSGEATIAYMELIQGDRPDYEFTWHSAVYSSGELDESPVLAVKSNTTVSDYQIGGVRPSYPEKGQVWALVENGRITSLQQYSGYAWLAVDGRIWTGSRWIPTGSFDVFTLQDFWDMQGTTSKDEYTYIYTESGFWDWWQKQWLAFTGTLFDKMDDSGGSGGGDAVPDLENDPLLDEEDKKEFDKDEYSGMVKLLRQAYSFVSDFFSGFTMGGIQDFLSDLTDSASPIYGLFWMNGL